MADFSTIDKVSLRILRYFIASVLLFTGIGKLLDVPGFVLVLETYQAIPEWGLHAVAVTMVIVELKICELLLRDKTLALGAFFSLLLHAFFTLWTVATLIRGVSVPNCGCFGVFFARPLSGWTVLEDLIMVAVSWRLVSLARRRKVETPGPKYSF